MRPTAHQAQAMKCAAKATSPRSRKIVMPVASGFDNVASAKESKTATNFLRAAHGTSGASDPVGVVLFPAGAPRHKMGPGKLAGI